MKETDDRYYEIQKRLIELRKNVEHLDDAELREFLGLHVEIRTYMAGYLWIHNSSSEGKTFEPIGEVIKKTYREKLRDPRWRKLRLQIFKRDGWTCQSCGTTEKCLQVHHLKYFPNTDPWDYPIELLKTLCEHCHEAIS